MRSKTWTLRCTLSLSQATVIVERVGVGSTDIAGLVNSVQHTTKRGTNKLLRHGDTAGTNATTVMHFLKNVGTAKKILGELTCLHHYTCT